MKMTAPDSEADTWRTVGTLLGNARRSLRLSKREAARRAGFAEITWRQLESGERQISRGTKVPPSPTDKTLEAAALAVELDPAEVFKVAGRRYQPTIRAPRPPLSGNVVTDQRLAELERDVDDLKARMVAMERVSGWTMEQQVEFQELVRRGHEILEAERAQDNDTN